MNISEIQNLRIQKLQAMMAKDGVDATLYATSGNMQYFLGDGSYYWHRTSETGGGLSANDIGSSRDGHALNKPDCILYIPADDQPILFLTYDKLDIMRYLPIKQIPSYFAMLGNKLEPYIKGKKRIAVGESCAKALKTMLGSFDNTIEITDGENYGEKLRVIKDSGEVAKLRRAAEFTDNAMGIVTKALKPGITPAEVRELIEAIGLNAGAQSISFGAAVICVEPGKPGSEELFSYPEDKPIQEGTAIGFDYGYVLDGYVSDYGRSFFVGRNQQAKEAYKALQEAQLHLLDMIKPGMPLNMCYDVLFDKLETKSLGKYLRKAEPCLVMGHQIGIDIHERPWLRGDVQGVFQPGMVICIEPKIMWPGLCYLRCEDMVLVTENGCESLTKFDRELFEL